MSMLCYNYNCLGKMEDIWPESNTTISEGHSDQQEHGDETEPRWAMENSVNYDKTTSSIVDRSFLSHNQSWLICSVCTYRKEELQNGRTEVYGAKEICCIISPGGS